MIAVFLTSFIVPLVGSLLITPWVIKFATYIKAVDTPGGRKIHAKVTPSIGGLAILLSFLISAFIIFISFSKHFEGLNNYTSTITLLAISFLCIFVLGFWDDITPLKPGIKLGVQFIIAGLVYLYGFKISNITNPFGDGLLNLEILDFPLTLLWIVGITNAFNLIDGLDGLASGVAVIACISIFIISAIAGDLWTALIALVMAGSLVGFLKYNFSPAKIFLGDSGSLLIGFSMALLSIQSTTKISTGFAVLFPILILGFPITDTLISMIRRLLGGDFAQRESLSFFQKIHRIFKADNFHIHHRLLSLGLTERNTVILLYFVSALFAVGAFIFTRVSTFEKSVSLALLFGFILYLGIKRLRYDFVTNINRSIVLPIYNKWILNRRFFISLIDIFFITISFIISYNLTYRINPSSIAELGYEQTQTLIIVLTTQVLTFWGSGVYRESIKQMGIGNALRITRSVGLSVIFTAFLLLIIDVLPFNSGFQFLVLDFYLLLTFTLGIRILYQIISYKFNRNISIGENILIYGANENGTMILHKIINSENNRVKVLGFLDDNPKLEGKIIYGYPVLGGHWKLPKMIRNPQKRIDCIFICEDDIKPENFNRLTKIAETNNITVKRLQIRLKNIMNQSSKNNISTVINGPTTSFQ